MRHLAANELHPSVAASTVASPPPLGRVPAENDYLSYLRAHFRVGPIIGALLFWGLAVLLYVLAMNSAHADSDHDQPPAYFTPVACYDLVQDVGRMIAWARWEQGLSLEKARSAEFRDGTPVWVKDLVQAWITDAYEWKVTQEQIRQWAGELGNVDNLPQVIKLDVHQTIAIWMRRIARQCNSRQA